MSVYHSLFELQGKGMISNNVIMWEEIDEGTQRSTLSGTAFPGVQGKAGCFPLFSV